LVENSPVTKVEDGAVICAGGRRIDFDELVWVTEAGAASWLADTGLALDGGGFIEVAATLRSVSDPNVFAAGDVTANVDHPRPKAGVFAVRQGPPLADNLRRALAGRPLVTFVPQRAFLSLISTGNRCAVASRGHLAAQGPILWRLKDWIDRRWMRQYQITTDDASRGSTGEVC
jgi:selenide,water dikinase